MKFMESPNGAACFHYSRIWTFCYRLRVRAGQLTLSANTVALCDKIGMKIEWAARSFLPISESPQTLRAPLKPRPAAG